LGRIGSLPKSFLKEQFRISLEKNAGDIAVLEKNNSCYRLIDVDGTEISLDQLLDRYFTNPYDCFIEYIEEQKNNIISLPDVRSILSEIPKNDIEEKYYYSCYYCDSFQKTNSKDDYESHIINKHGLGHPCYPCKADFERLGIKAQGKSWEI
jgi:hypothetical protein